MLKHISLTIVIFCAIATVIQAQIVLAEVLDTNLSRELPKGIELYAKEDIEDLSIFAVGSSNNESGPDRTVIAQNLKFVPRDITIEVGETVRWTNPETNVEHNVNGGKNVFPCNPVGFFSGIATDGPWDYDFMFNQAGIYNYQCDPHVSFDMLGSVTVVDSAGPDYPAYDISTLTTVDINGVVDSLEVTCTIEGIVYGTNLRPGELLFTVIDDDGRGIGVIKSDMDCYEVTEGDRIVMQGFITQNNGLTQFQPTRRIEVLSTGNALVEPELVEGPVSEAVESKLILVENVRIDTIITTGTSGWRVMASNDNADYLIRLNAEPFSEPTFWQGAIVTVTGIGGQFDSLLPYTDGYEIAPRSPDDVQYTMSTEFLPENSIAMYPNPAVTIVHFETELKIEAIHVFTTSGTLVTIDKKSELNISGLAPAVYIVKVLTGDGVWTARFIKIN